MAAINKAAARPLMQAGVNKPSLGGAPDDLRQQSPPSRSSIPRMKFVIKPRSPLLILFLAGQYRFSEVETARLNATDLPMPRKAHQNLG